MKLVGVLSPSDLAEVCTWNGPREGFSSAKNMIAHLIWASLQTTWFGGVEAVRGSGLLCGGSQHR